MRTGLFVVVGCLALVLLDALPSRAETDTEQACNPAAVPLPKMGKDFALAEYERELFTWLHGKCYRKLEGWKRDKHVRDAGPYILGTDYGLHPAPRIYYSPEVIAWLENERKGELGRGAAIIKEMFNPPAARYSPEECHRKTGRPCQGSKAADQAYQDWINQQELHGGWAVMIKDGKSRNGSGNSQGAIARTKDGWFWGSTWINSPPKSEFEGQLATNAYPFPFRFSGFGEPSCLRCHAVAESESTFSDLRNIEGEPGEPARFRVDNSWRDDLPPELRPGRGLAEAALLEFAFHGAPRPELPGTSPEVKADPKTGKKHIVHPEPNADFTRYFELGPVSKPVPPAQFTFPGQWADHVPAGPGGAEQFITSDNCYGCHGGLGGPPYPISMFVKTGAASGDGFNISPYGEWRWSPMGLAGRDPIFHAQLETEVEILETYDKQRLEKAGTKNVDQVVGDLVLALQDTCLSCHGAMGQRQLLIDHKKDKRLNPNMLPEYFYLSNALTEEDLEKDGYKHDYPYQKYGNLGREGISCTICHHIDPPAKDPRYPDHQNNFLNNFLMTSTTGVFPYSPPGELNGPFEDVRKMPMQNALGITPQYNAYIRDSRMCGTCHTINLPNVDAKHDDTCYKDTGTTTCYLDEAAKNAADLIKKEYGVDYAERLAVFPHSIEQATFLEWQNSSFAQPGSFFKSCQDCHMSGSFHATTDEGTIQIEQVTSQIATIQDSTYPQVDNGLPDSEVTVPLRDDYRRHDLVGLNAFLLEMTRQFDDVLGLAQSDYMTGATTGNAFAIENIQRQAREESIRLSVDRVEVDDDELTADVTLTNLVGHRLTSGVSFRRLWIEFAVMDGDDKTIFASGSSNDVGLILDGKTGDVLPSDLTGPQTKCFERRGDACHLVDPTCYQPHFDGTVSGTRPITEPTQVQIYEEIVLNAACELTTSFVHRDHHVKDNRLLPRGWKASGEFKGDPILQQFMKATDPEGTGKDPDYKSHPGKTFPGKDTVRYVVKLPAGTVAKDLHLDVKVHFQALTPFWLREKFTTSPEGKATQRLYYIASRLETEGSPIEGWKLLLGHFNGPVVP